MTLATLGSGELFSGICALLWAVAIILFRKSGEQVPPVPLNVFKNTLATILFPLTMVVLGVPLCPAESTAADWLLLLLSGAIGIGIADTCLFASLNRIGAGRNAIVESGYSPCVILCSSLFLHEPVSATLLLAVALMVCAIIVGAWNPDRRGPPRLAGEIRQGVLLGIAALVLMAIGVVLAKPVIVGADAWWASAVRLFGGMGVLVVHGALPKHRPGVKRCFTPNRLWLVTVPAAIIGSYLAMFFWILGMKHTYTTTASVLNQLSTIFVLALATVFLREPLTRRKLLAISLGFVGAIIAVT
jgi:drug/metabolite transporter (DMT)-like permease